MDAALVCAICGFQVSAPDGFPAAQLEMDAHYAATGHGATQAATALDAARAAATAAVKIEYRRRRDYALGGEEAVQDPLLAAEVRDDALALASQLLRNDPADPRLEALDVAYQGVLAMRSARDALLGWIAASADSAALSTLAATPSSPPPGAPGWPI